MADPTPVPAGDNPANGNDGQGADEDLRRAVDLVLAEAETNPKDVRVEAALSYLRARVPLNTHARAMLQLLIDHLDAYWKGQYSLPDGLDNFALISVTIYQFRDALDRAGLRIARPGSAAELAAIADELSLSLDWHEPDSHGVSALTTGLRFDNAGIAHTEQMVVLYRDDVPVAQVALANLFAWVTATHR